MKHEMSSSGQILQPSPTALIPVADQPLTTRIIKPRVRDANWETHLLDEDDRESRIIIKHNKGKSLDELQVIEAWHGSAAQQLLAEFPRYGLWIHTWLAKITKHPSRARVLAWLLRKFDGNKKGQCHARNVDENGLRWWLASISTISKESLLHEGAVERAIRWLSTGATPLIFRESAGRDGTRLRPNAIPLLQAYLNVSKDPDAISELENAGPQLQWWDCMSRVKATAQGIPGVRVHDALTVICDCHAGQAALLATILHWHSVVKKTGLTRARITRGGYLWIAKSGRQLMQELGHSPQAIDGWRRALADKGYITFDYWLHDRRRDYGQPTLHLRPNPAVIEQALANRKDDILYNFNNR